MFMVDLAVPRDIEPEIAAMEDVYLYDIDDLAGLVRDGKDARQSAVTEAEAIIEARTDDFLEWLRARENVPLIRQLREHADGQRQQELSRALNQLQQGQSPEAVLEALSRSLTNKLLHPPLEALSQVGAQEAGLLSRIYRIETQSSKDNDEL
jgi:glutamyl-tRNA reductase